MNIFDIRKYSEREIQLCQKIGQLLDQKIKSNYRKKKELVDIICKEMNFNVGTGYALLIEYSKGSFVYHIAPKSSGFKQIYLDRLATFYKILKISENDKVIQMTKEVNENFEY